MKHMCRESSDWFIVNSRKSINFGCLFLENSFKPVPSTMLFTQNLILVFGGTTSTNRMILHCAPNGWFKGTTLIFGSSGEFGLDFPLRFTTMALLRNRGLCLPLLKYNIDIRYWVPKVMCGGIEKQQGSSDEIDLWLISR
jgi:hypothetical protein